ncbi:MAG: HAD family hydrolase [Anaeroplasmataceae bacterium]|nr:HAD family hydrolase [Anaeroplasmataceae bacterium]
MEIYLDLENTLFSQEKKLSEDGLNILKKISEKHQIVILTTGILNEAKELFSIQNLKIVSTIESKLYLNGTYQYTPLNCNVLNQFIDSPHIYTLYGISEDTTYIIKYQERMKTFYPTKKIEICSSFPSNIASFIVAVYKEGLEELMKALSDFKVVTLASDSKKALLLVSHLISTKEAWLLKLKESPAIGIGDSFTDYDFIKHCEVQVAMKNGEDELKTLCNYITNKTNQENGALEFLLTYLKLQQV